MIVIVHQPDSQSPAKLRRIQTIVLYNSVLLEKQFLRIHLNLGRFVNLAQALNPSGLGVVVCNMPLASTYRNITNLLKVTLEKKKPQKNKNELRNVFFWK